MKLILAGLFLGWAAAASGADQLEVEKLMRRLKRTDPARLPPSTVLPEHHRHMEYVVHGKIGERVLHPTSIPLYNLTPTSRDHLPTVGQLPVGTNVTLESVEAYKGRQFYRVKRKDGQPVPDGWIDGMFLMATGQVSYDPDKPLDSKAP